MALSDVKVESKTSSVQMTRGILLMLLGLSLYPLTDAFLKHIMSMYSVHQTTFLRSCTRAFPLMLFALFQGNFFTNIKTENPGRHAVRIMVNLGSTYAFMLACSMTSLTSIYTLSYTSPLFMILLSSLVLKETIDKEKWFAVGMGLLGVLIATRPGTQVFEWSSIIVLGGTALAAMNKILMRRLSKTETLLSITLYPNISMMLITLPFVWTSWQPMSWQHITLFVLVGAFTATAQWAIAKALQYAEASMLAPIDYSTFFWVVTLDALVWDKIPDMYTVSGALIIVTSNLFILWKSRQDSKRKAALETVS